MSEQKILTGIAGLDHLLKGGLLPNASIMVEGTPGTGKSTLAMQFIAAGVSLGEPGIIVTLEEYPSEFYRDALHYGWDFQKWEKEDLVRVIATSPSALKEQIEGGGPLANEIQAIGAKRIVIDSVNHFERMSTDAAFLRTMLSGLIHSFKMEGLISFFTKDIETKGILEYWGRYSVDVLIELSFVLLKDRERYRYIELHKARGQDHILGRHSFDIMNRGVEIYPRAVQPDVELARPKASRITRIPSGVGGMDEMMNGGFILGQSTLVAGTAGTGKSLIACSFAAAGMAQGERALYISMEDPPERILQNAGTVGLDLERGVREKLVSIYYLPPVELSPDELLFSVNTWLDTGKYQRVVIDSVSSLRGVTPEPEYLRDVMIALAGACFTRNVAGLFTAEVENMTGPFRLSEFGASFLSDAIILLRLIEVSGELKKALSIVKMRGTSHDHRLRELEITGKGLKIGEPFENLSGILTGTPTESKPIGYEAYFGEVSQEQQRIVAILAERKEATAEEIAKAANIDVARVHHTLDNLAETGFVTRTKIDGQIHYRAALMKAR